MINLQDIQLPGLLLCTIATIFLLPNFASSSDPCPPARKLYPCWCTDFALYDSTTSTDSTTSEATSTSTTVNPTTTTATSTTAVGSRRRRHAYAKRQINPFLSRDSYYTIVTCNGTDNTHDLERGVGEGLRKRWIDKLVLSTIYPDDDDGETKVRFPKDLLRNTRVKELEIRDTFLANDFIHNGNPLDGQDQSMMWFTVVNCSLGGQLSYSDVGAVNTKGLNKLMRVEGVDFSGNHLESIRDMAFRYPPPNLTTIDLSYNSIRVLEYRCFQFTPKLRFVDLSHNHLESIQRSVFASPAKHLYHIDLSWNRLAALPGDFFVNMPSLKIVNISSNYLYSMPSTPWSAIWRQLQVIDVTGNYLPCDCSLMWLLPMLSDPNGNGTTRAPRPLQGQTVLGSCSFFRRNSFPQHHDLISLTRSSLNC